MLGDRGRRGMHGQHVGVLVGVTDLAVARVLGDEDLELRTCPAQRADVRRVCPAEGCQGGEHVRDGGEGAREVHGVVARAREDPLIAPLLIEAAPRSSPPLQMTTHVQSQTRCSVT